MGLTVILESPPGSRVQTTKFEPGQEIRIGGKVTGSLGVPEPANMQISIFGPQMETLYVETRSNWQGNYWEDFRLPNIYGEAQIRVVANFFIGGRDVRFIPIGIGAPAESDPSPAPGDPLTDTVEKVGETINKWALWVFLAAVVLAGFFVFLKARK